MGTQHHKSSKLIDLHIAACYEKQNAEEVQKNQNDQEILNAEYTPSLVLKKIEVSQSKRPRVQNNASCALKQLSIIQQDSDEFSKFSSFNLSSFRRNKQKYRIIQLQNPERGPINETISIINVTKERNGRTGEIQSEIKKSSQQNYSLPCIEQIQPELNLDEAKSNSSVHPSSLIKDSNVRDAISFDQIDDKYGQQEIPNTFEKCLSLTQKGFMSYRQENIPLFGEYPPDNPIYFENALQFHIKALGQIQLKNNKECIEWAQKFVVFLIFKQSVVISNLMYRSYLFKQIMKNNLKQPKKYTHNSLSKQASPQEEGAQDQKNNKSNKTKKINKLQDKKIINKKNEPSALRLAAINQTFHKIQNNTDSMLKSFQIDQQLLNQFISYNHKVKCKCQRNIRFYCLKCLTKNEQLAFPLIELPFNVRVVHHDSEKINKSSIAPMTLLSQQIKLSTFYSNSKPSSVLSGLEPAQTCILFPHKLSKKVNETNFENIKNIVILDCTWFQTDQIVTCLQKQGYSNYIRLEDYQSLYWRYNHHSDKALSSAEAFAYFLRQYQQHIHGNKTQYDKLMFLYLLNLKIIQNSYREHSDAQNEIKQEKQEEEHEENA